MTFLSKYKTWTLPDSAQGRRLDKWCLSQGLTLPFRKLQKLIRTGDILINQKRTTPAYLIQPGDTLEIYKAFGDYLAEERPKKLLPISPFWESTILKASFFKSPSLWVVNKPRGLSAQGGSGQKVHLIGLLESLFQKEAFLKELHNLYGGKKQRGWQVMGDPTYEEVFTSQGRAPSPKLVHRLDQATTGLFLLPLDPLWASHLALLFKSKAIKKTYLALCWGKVSPIQGRVNLPLLRRNGVVSMGEKMVITDPSQGKEAVTDYEVIAQNESYSLVKCLPRTGRTHQIRVHLSHLGHPILGDPRYGKGAAERGQSLMLHSYALECPSPQGHPLFFQAPPPEDFTKTLKDKLGDVPGLER